MESYRKMLVEDWIKVTPCPIQRDTEKHAAKAKHLLTPHPTHSFVSAAELPSGKLVKLDGHTRALLWKRKDVPPPIQVNVAVIPVKDMEEVEQLYKDYDSREALETQRDKVSGAFNRHNFEPQSGLLQAGNLTYSLRISYGMLIGMTSSGASSGGSTSRSGPKANAKAKADTYMMIDEFSYELHALDGLNITQGGASAGVIAAFIVSYRKYGHKVTPFWVGVFGKGGSKSHGQMDGIQALCELILDRKGRYGGTAAADMCARSLMAIEKWLKDETLSTIPRPLDTTDYLVGYEKPSERLIKAKDVGKKK